MKKIKLYSLFFALLLTFGSVSANSIGAFNFAKIEKVVNAKPLFRTVITTVTTVDTFAVYGPYGEILYWLTVTTTVTTTVTYP